MVDNLTRALDNPEKFFWNVLLEEEDLSDEIIYLDTCIFLSVLLFLVSNQGDNDRIVNNFIKQYYYQVEKEIQTVKEPTNDTEKRFLHLCEKHPVIRDIIYIEEKKVLSECITDKDYKNYLNLYSESSREFTLFAEYKIAQLSNQNDFIFDAIPEVVSSYPNSDLFDIDKLKTLCEVVNGIFVCFKSNITDNQKDAILSILQNSTYDEDAMVYIVSSPLSKFHFLKLQDFNEELLLSAVSNMYDPIYLDKDEAEHVLSTLCNLTGILWALPEKEIVNDNALFTKNKNKIWIEVESDSSIKTYYNLQPIIKTEKE